MYDIPNSRASITGKELTYLQQALQSGHLHGDGAFTEKCHQLLENRYGVAKVLLTHSGTGALEMAAWLGEIQPGDEFIVPSFTFSSTANAFALRGGIPVWCDIRSDTLNLDESQIENLITERTKAIVPVHYGGVGCEMDTIMDIATRHRILVVEDAAQAIETFYKGRPLGTLGDFGCLSFHGSKNIVAGEGGALFINDERSIERSEIIREKGTNRSQFLRGQVDKYRWIDIGSSYLPSELTAAFLLAQLEEIKAITNRRLAVWQQYIERLTPFADAGKLSLPSIPPDCRHNGHLFYILLPNETERNRVMNAMQAKGILAIFHYVPLHLAPAGKRLDKSVKLPCTEEYSRRLLRLPMYADITHEEVDAVVTTLDRVL